MAREGEGAPAGTGVRGAPSLLDHIANSALEDDYYHVDDPEPLGRSIAWSWRTALVLALFGALATLAAGQTRVDRPIVQEQRSALVSNLEERSADLAESQERVAALDAEIAELQGVADARRNDSDQAALIGAGEVRGPALRVTLTSEESPVSVFDIQRTVNGLWGAGAEAVAVNGQRMTTLSAVRTANDAIVINYEFVSPPYVVTAIGDTESMGERFELVDGGQHLRRRGDEGLGVEIETIDRVTLPAAPSNRVTLDHAAVSAGEDHEGS